MLFLRVTLGILGFGSLSLVVLGAILGDVDDLGVVFFAIGIPMGVLAGLACHKGSLPAKVWQGLGVVSALGAVTLIAAVVWALKTGEDLITGEAMKGGGVLVLIFLHSPAIVSCVAIAILMGLYRRGPIPPDSP